MNLDRLRLFYYVAKAQSFTHTDIPLSPSALSRQISTLEHELKSVLFHRYPRKLELTDKGHMLFELASKFLVEMENVERHLKDKDSEPRGILRLTAPFGWASSLLFDMLPAYLERYPQMRLHVKAVDSEPNFSEGKVDLAIFPFLPNAPHLKYKHLYRFHLKLYASKGYIEKYGLPERPEDLDHHQLIAYDQDFSPFRQVGWHLTLGRAPDKPREPFLVVSDLYQAVVKGLGITALAVENPLRIKSDLVEVLPEYDGPDLDIYCIYPDHLVGSRRVQSFIDFLSASVQELIQRI